MSEYYKSKRGADWNYGGGKWKLSRSKIDFVYANGLRDRKAFDGKLEFNVTIISYTGEDKWIPTTLADIKKCLDSDAVPAPADDCDYCTYRKAAAKVSFGKNEKL